MILKLSHFRFPLNGYCKVTTMQVISQLLSHQFSLAASNGGGVEAAQHFSEYLFTRLVTPRWYLYCDIWKYNLMCHLSSLTSGERINYWQGRKLRVTICPGTTLVWIIEYGIFNISGEIEWRRYFPLRWWFSLIFLYFIVGWVTS